MASVITCKVHPVVILNVLDFYERRPETKEGVQSKVIGTLLGTYEKGVVEITNCYSVPHAEIKNEEAHMQTAFNKEMLDLFRKSNPAETPVGWFSTSSEVNSLSLNFHDYYQEFVKSTSGTREQLPIIMLTVDTSLKTGRMGIKAYARTRAGIPRHEEPHCAIFMPVEVEVVAFDTEQVGVDLIMAGKDTPKRTVELQSGVAHLKKTTEEMVQWIQRLKKYVDEVLSGQKAVDSAVGRRLMELVAGATHVDPKQFESLINGSLKDYLMVVYLAQLAKTQLALNEKLVKM
jgi:translation initiation factor 3 subunit F